MIRLSYPEDRNVVEAQIVCWYLDAIANRQVEPIEPGHCWRNVNQCLAGIDPIEAALVLDGAGLITLKG